MMIRLVNYRYLVQPTQVEPAGGSQYLVLQHSPWAGRGLWTVIPLKPDHEHLYDIFIDDAPPEPC